MPSNLLEMVPSAKCSIPTMRVDRNGELYGEARITMGKAVMVFEIIDEELSAESGPEIEKDPDDIIDEDLSDADWAKIAKALTKKFQREIEQEVKDTMEANKDDDTSSSRYAVRAAMRGQAPKVKAASELDGLLKARKQLSLEVISPLNGVIKAMINPFVINDDWNSFVNKYNKLLLDIQKAADQVASELDGLPNVKRQLEHEVVSPLGDAIKALHALPINDDWIFIGNHRVNKVLKPVKDSADKIMDALIDAGDSMGVQHKQAAGGNNLVKGFQKLAAAVLLSVRGPWRSMEFELLDTFGYGITLNLPAGQHLWASINIHAEGGESKIMIGADLYVNDDMVEEEYKFFNLDTAEGALTSALQKICMNLVALVDRVENE